MKELTIAQQVKLELMLQGTAVVASDSDLNAYIEADVSVDMRSARNIKGCGLNDRWIVWLGDKLPPQFRNGHHTTDFTAFAVAGQCK